MSIKQAIIEISRGFTITRPEPVYEFSVWYRSKHHTGTHFPGVLEIMDELAERSEDYLEQEYARFILETSE